MARTFNIGNLEVRIGADEADLVRSVEKSKRALGDLDSFARRAKGIATWATAAAAAAAAVAVAMTKSSLSTLDSQAKLAARLGGTTAAMQAVTRAAQLAGVSTEQIAKSAEMLNARLGEAQRRGMGPAADALERLGLRAEELIGLDIDERLAVIADRFDQMGLSTAAQADELKELGVRSKELINLFQGGGTAIRNARQEVDDFAVSISEIDAIKIQNANDAMTQIGLTMSGVGNQIAVQLSPFLKAIADDFGEAARQSGGFSDEIARGMSIATSAIGFFLDEIRLLRLNWDEAVGDFLDGVNLVIRGISVFARSSESFQQIEHSYGKLREELGEELPSEQLERWVDRVKARADEAAQAMLDARKKIGGDAGEGVGRGDGMTEEQRKALEKQAEADAKRLEQLKLSLMSQEELETLDYEKRLAALQEFLNKKQITEAEAIEGRERLETQHMDRLNEIRKSGFNEMQRFMARSYADQASIVMNELRGLAAGVESQSRTMFEINKAAALGSAVVNTYQGITKSLSEYPMPLAGIMAAAHAAAGFAQVNALARTQFGSRGSAGAATSAVSAASSTAQSASAQPQAGPQQTLFVRGLSAGSLLDGDSVRELAQRLIDFQRDGGKVVLGS